MNKIALLTLVLLVALPGCGNGNKQSAQPVKKNSVAKYIDISDDEEIVEDDEDVENMLNFDDEEGEETTEDEEDDAEEVSEEDEELTEDDLRALGEDEEDEEEDDQFTWIDAQIDDELKPLYFSFNHYGLRPDQNTAINYNVEQVKQLLSESGTSAQPTVIIEGHACQEGTPAYNVALSEKRAKNVADLFVAAGVDKNAIKVVGRGQECPAIINGKPVNGSREARWPNRRVEVRVMYT